MGGKGLPKDKLKEIAASWLPDSVLVSAHPLISCGVPDPTVALFQDAGVAELKKGKNKKEVKSMMVTCHCQSGKGLYGPDTPTCLGLIWNQG